MSEVKRAFSRLCDKGFPIKGGVHYGTQSLGMIPSRVCDNASPEESAKWIVESSSANSASEKTEQSIYESKSYFDLNEIAGRRGYSLAHLPYVETPAARREIIEWLTAYDERLLVPSSTEGVPERVFLKACHPSNPNRHCSWSVSKDAQDSIEYVRADLAGDKPHEFQSKHGTDSCWHCDKDSAIHPVAGDQGEGIAESLNPASYEDYPDTELAEAPIPRYQELVANASPAGKLWVTWFERMGEHATIDTVNATANLVIAERELIINERDSLVKEVEYWKVTLNATVDSFLIDIKTLRADADSLREHLKSTAAGYHHASHTDRFEDCESSACVAAREAIQGEGDKEDLGG